MLPNLRYCVTMFSECDLQELQITFDLHQKVLRLLYLIECTTVLLTKASMHPRKRYSVKSFRVYPPVTSDDLRLH